MLNLVRTLGLIVFIFLLGFLLPDSALATGDFSNTCREINLVNQTTVRAICKRRDQSEQYTTTDLNRYIANADGQLSWDLNGGKFILTCQQPNLLGEIQRLGAYCKKRNGATQITFINLNEHIANIDGFLKYQDGGGIHDEL